MGNSFVWVWNVEEPALGAWTLMTVFLCLHLGHPWSAVQCVAGGATAAGSPMR